MWLLRLRDTLSFRANKNASITDAATMNSAFRMLSPAMTPNRSAGSERR